MAEEKLLLAHEMTIHNRLSRLSVRESVHSYLGIRNAMGGLKETNFKNK